MLAMRLALAQINPTIGDLDANAELILRFARLAADAGAQLAVFPELAICGYPPKDLLLQEGFIAACAQAAGRVAAQSPRELVFVFGGDLWLDRRHDAG